MTRLRMLAACEMSGRVRDAFAARGWESWSADLLPSETPASYTLLDDGCYDIDPGAPTGTGHYQGDVRDLFDAHHPVNFERTQEWCQAYADSWSLWDLVIAFPPCDHLSLAGARYWKQKRADGRQDAAAAFLMEMVNAPAKYVAVENPVGDMKRRYRAPDQVVQPYMFGDALTKKTCLWLKNLPLLVPDNVVEPLPGGRVATGGGSYRVDKRATGLANNLHEDSEGRAMRRIVRSRTLPGLARAMASQWGAYVEKEEGADA